MNTFLYYNPDADLGKVVRKKRNGTPHNTSLENSGKGTMQAACKCFKRVTQGSCSGHYAEHYSRMFAAEAVLEDADKKIAALDVAFAAMGNVALRAQFDSRPFLAALKDVIALRSSAPEKLRPRGAKK